MLSKQIVLDSILKCSYWLVDELFDKDAIVSVFVHGLGDECANTVESYRHGLWQKGSESKVMAKEVILSAQIQCLVSN